MRAFSHFSIRFRDGQLEVLDQTVLPDHEVWLVSKCHSDMVGFIQRLAVRGAPMIAVAACLALALEASRGASESDLRRFAAELRASRPTAVNLMNSMDRLVPPPPHLHPISSAKLIAEAYQIMADEVEMNNRMAHCGAALVQHGEAILTHCNTGSLATPGVGTALGVIREAHKQVRKRAGKVCVFSCLFEKGKKIHVYVDETRPLLQGGRLTA